VIPEATHGMMPVDASGAIRREAVNWFDRWLCAPVDRELDRN
jgi:hypothetical protein